MRHPRLTLAVLCVSLVAGTAAPAAAAPMSVAEARASTIDRASAALDVPGRSLRMVAFEPMTAPDEADAWYIAKVQRAGRRPGTPYLAYVEPESGRVIPVARWRQTHPVADVPKVDGDAAARLARGGTHTVAVWIRGPSERQVARRVHRAHPALVDRHGRTAAGGQRATLAARDLMRSANIRAASSAVDPVAARARSLGLRVEYASAIVPVLWVTGSAAPIRRLAARDDVIRVQSSGRTSLALAEAGASDQVSGKNGFSHRRGYLGRGVRIAVVEYGNVSWGVPDLDSIPASRREAYTTEPGRFPREGHPTAVMSIIASDSRSHRGIAPAATYISSGTGGEQGGSPSEAEDFRALQALENAILPGKGNADVVNASFGQETAAGSAAMRAFVDHVVRVYDVHVAAAAGNTVSQARCQGASHPVVAPGTGWNVVTVGGVDDRGTASWGDDRLYRDTCDGDPAGGTFKPEISAPAVAIRVNGESHTGTSFASPQVAGAMALLIDQVEDLRTRPHVVKAILLAGSFLRRTVTDRVHATEGVGTLAMKWAHWAAGNKRKGGAAVAASGELMLDAGPDVDGCREMPPYQTVMIDTQPGRRVRFVASWESHGSYDQGSAFGPNDDFVDGRRSDIDVIVRTADGERKTASVSANRTVEVAQWRTRRSELPYTVWVKPIDWDCDLDSETVGWAWVAPR